MMHSRNPVLSREDAFVPAGHQSNPYQQGNQFDPHPGGQGYQAPQPQDGGRMTIEDVITKTAITMLVMMASAAALFFGVETGMIPMTGALIAMAAGGLITFILSLVVAFRRSVSPALVIPFAIFEGLFVGGISWLFEQNYPGIVASAVLGTFVAAAVVLASYKFFNIKVTPRFRRIIFCATLGFAVAALLNFVLSLFGINLGLRDGGTGPVSMIAVGFSLLGAILASLNLILDFDYVEQGIRDGAPAKASWKAAFGLTVTLVWLYVEILRLLSYLRR